MTLATRSRAWIPFVLLAMGLLVAAGLWLVGREVEAPSTPDHGTDPVAEALLRGREAPSSPQPGVGAASAAEDVRPPAPGAESPFSVSGRVFVGRTKAPVPDARVQVSFTLGSRTESLGTATTQPDGTYALALPRLEDE